MEKLQPARHKDTEIKMCIKICAFVSQIIYIYSSFKSANSQTENSQCNQPLKTVFHYRRMCSREQRRSNLIGWRQTLTTYSITFTLC